MPCAMECFLSGNFVLSYSDAFCGNTTHLFPHFADLDLDLFDPDVVDQDEC